MKTNAINLGILLFSAATVLVSCKKEELRPLNVPAKTPALSEVKDNSTKELPLWKVSKLYIWGETESDETSKFLDWGFRFNRDGVVVATLKDKTVRGIWAVKTGAENNYLFMDFGDRRDFSFLNNTWRIVKETSDYRSLVDENGDDGMKGELLFEKIK
jgi:hypothetical protein